MKALLPLFSLLLLTACSPSPEQAQLQAEAPAAIAKAGFTVVKLDATKILTESPYGFRLLYIVRKIPDDGHTYLLSVVKRVDLNQGITLSQPTLIP